MVDVNSLDPAVARRLFERLIEQAMSDVAEMASDAQALVLRFITLLMAEPTADPWKEWSDFSRAFTAATSVPSYRALLEDRDRR